MTMPLTIESIARVCHEANRALCEELGDHSQVAWSEAPDWQRLSTIDGIMYATGNVDLTPEDMHRSWMSRKVDDGWTFGPVKDAAIKTHPCLIPYDELPEIHKRKDALFLAIVRALSGLDTFSEAPTPAEGHGA